MSKTENSGATKIITPEAILSYPHLVKPQAAEEGGKEKYSASFVFPKGTDLSGMKKAMIAAAKEKFGDKGVEMLRKKTLRSPFRDDPEDVAKKGYAEGSVFVNARSDRKPGVVSVYKDPKNPTKPAVIPDDQVEEALYPGSVVKGSLVAFYYERKGNKGIGFALNNIQKVREGDRLDSRVNAQDEFEADESAEASLEGLEDDDSATEDSGDDLADLLK